LKTDVGAPTSRLLAEAAGTFILLFVGTGAIIVDARSDAGLGTTGIALAFGLAIAAGVFTTRHISGAHFNPAITLAMTAAGRFRAIDILPYIGAQLAGAIAASLLLRTTYGMEGDLGATTASIALWKAFVIEFAFTGFLAFVIAEVASKGEELPNGLAAIAIGGAVAMGALVAGPVTGGSMNPARSFAPALAGWQFDDLWIYWLAPPLGAVAAALLHGAIARPRER
jgi:MIP family channel proteins